MAKERTRVADLVEGGEPPVVTEHVSLVMARSKDVMIAGQQFKVAGVPLTLFPDLMRMLSSSKISIDLGVLEEVGKTMKDGGGVNLQALFKFLLPLSELAPDFMGAFLREEDDDDGTLKSVGREWIVEHACTFDEFVDLIVAVLETTNFARLMANFQSLGRAFKDLAPPAEEGDEGTEKSAGTNSSEEPS